MKNTLFVRNYSWMILLDYEVGRGKYLITQVLLSLVYYTKPSHEDVCRIH